MENGSYNTPHKTVMHNSAAPNDNKLPAGCGNVMNYLQDTLLDQVTEDSTSLTFPVSSTMQVLSNVMWTHGVEKPFLSAGASPLACLTMMLSTSFLYSTPNNTSPLMS